MTTDLLPELDELSLHQNNLGLIANFCQSGAIRKSNRRSCSGEWRLRLWLLSFSFLSRDDDFFLLFHADKNDTARDGHNQDLQRLHAPSRRHTPVLLIVRVAAATVFEVVVIFVFFEAVPKNWAVHHPERAALASAPVVRWLLRFPLIRLPQRR